MNQVLRVLHVEDDPSIRLVTSIALGKVGNFQVLSCDSGKMALDKAAAFDPQVLLLDVMMPEMDGPATLKHLRQKIDVGQRLVLFMTAKVQQKELDEYISIGAFGVILKPFDPMTLARQVEEHWANFQKTLQTEQ